MISELYKDYFQKSRAFLYPLVNINKKAAFTPEHTYLSWKGMYTPSDHRLIATYDVDVTTEKWKAFVENFLQMNPFFEDYSHTLSGDLAVVVFNMEKRFEAYDCVVQGKYSKIHADMRSLILTYYGYQTGEWAYMETFMIPDKFIKLYAKLLDVEENMLDKNGELCESPNMDKEILIINTQRNYYQSVV